KFFLNPPFPLTTADAAPLPFTVTAPYFVAAFGPNFKLPRTYQWNLSLQQSLGVNQSGSATYLGAAGRELLRSEGLVPFPRRSPNFGEILVTTNGAYSNYNALQLQYQRRLSRGLQVLASYTWAHSLDNTPTTVPIAPYHTVYNPDLDYGHSDFDVRHSFS